MVAKRYSHSAVAFRDNIFIIGGVDNNGQYLSSGEVLDNTTMKVSSIKWMNNPRQLFAIAISGKFIFCFGGYNLKYKFLDR